MMARVVVVLACLAISGRAGAQTRCAAIDGGSPSLAAVDAETRLAFIHETMRDQGSRAHTWAFAWSGIGYGLAAAQYALVPLMPADRRLEQAFEGTAALFIPLSIAVVPPRAPAHDEALEQLLHRASTPSGVMSPCLVLARAEELLEATADDEAARTGVLEHVFTFLLNTGYVAILGFGFKYLPGTIVGGAGAYVIGELEILTAPRGAVHALEHYRLGEIGAPPPQPRLSLTVAPLGVAPGLSLVGRF